MRLSEVDPEALAEAEWRRAIDAVHSRLFALAPLSTYTLTLGDAVPAWRASVYGHAVYAIAKYARHGTPLDADLHEYCVSLVGPGDAALDDSGDPDPGTALGFVVACAMAREMVDLGRPLTLRQLAMLGGVTPGRIRQIVDAGGLRVSRRGDEMTVSAAECRRWLGAKGVAGYVDA